MELANHQDVTANTGLDVYSADPRSSWHRGTVAPWHRGTNANMNRLLRHDLPNGASMEGLTQTDLALIAAKLTARPRKTPDVDSPASRFDALLR